MKETFEKASRAKSLEELDMIINQTHEMTKTIDDFKNKYPDIDLTVNRQEVESLVAEGVINEDHTINLSGMYNFSTFEKLLLPCCGKMGI